MTKRPPIPLDVPAVAARMGVKVDTVWKWRQRAVLPIEDGTVSGAPWWWPETIDEWADETGRTPDHFNEETGAAHFDPHCTDPTCPPKVP